MYHHGPKERRKRRKEKLEKRKSNGREGKQEKTKIYILLHVLQREGKEGRMKIQVREKDKVTGGRKGEAQDG